MPIDIYNSCLAVGLKPFQNEKDQNIFQVYCFWCLFLQLAAEKKTPKTVHLEIFLALLILKRI